MPIYEFRCDTCHHQFDELIMGSQHLADVRCPQCGDSHVQRMMSAFGFSSGSTTVTSSGNGCSSCASKNCASCGH